MIKKGALNLTQQLIRIPRENQRETRITLPISSKDSSGWIRGKKSGSVVQAHQPDEYVELHSLYAALDVLARFLQIS